MKKKTIWMRIRNTAFRANLEDGVLMAGLLDFDDKLGPVVGLGDAAEVLAPLVHVPHRPVEPRRH